MHHHGQLDCVGGQCGILHSFPFCPSHPFQSSFSPHEDLLKQEVQSLLHLGLSSRFFLNSSEEGSIPNIPGSQDRRRLEDDSKSQEHGHLHPFMALQDDNLSHHNSISRLVCHPQPPGCLLSYSHSLLPQMLSALVNRLRTLSNLHPPQGSLPRSFQQASSPMLVGYCSISIFG